MYQQKKWLERVFKFDLDLWIYPNFVERLRGTPARVEDRVKNMPDDVLAKRDGARWSIQEHIGHLFDVEELWLARLEDFEAGKSELTPADMENPKTDNAKHNEKPIGDIIEAFRGERSKIVGKLDAYDESFVGRSAKHPRLGTQMRVLDLVSFIAEHDDHHLATITRLIDRFQAKSPEPAARIAERFVEAINAHDVDALCDLMTADHVLIDAGGQVIEGSGELRDAWKAYFAMFPDYHVSVARVFEQRSWVAVAGSARGTYSVDGTLSGDNAWVVSAAWLAGIRDDKVWHWQVYADNEPVRQILERHHRR